MTFFHLPNRTPYCLVIDFYAVTKLNINSISIVDAPRNPKQTQMKQTTPPSL